MMRALTNMIPIFKIKYQLIKREREKKVIKLPIMSTITRQMVTILRKPKFSFPKVNVFLIDAKNPVSSMILTQYKEENHGSRIIESVS